MKIAVGNVFIKLFVVWMDHGRVWRVCEHVYNLKQCVGSELKSRVCEKKKWCVNAMPQHKTWKRYKELLRWVKWSFFMLGDFEVFALHRTERFTLILVWILTSSLTYLRKIKNGNDKIKRKTKNIRVYKLKYIDSLNQLDKEQSHDHLQQSHDHGNTSLPAQWVCLFAFIIFCIWLLFPVSHKTKQKKSFVALEGDSYVNNIYNS